MVGYVYRIGPSIHVIEYLGNKEFADSCHITNEKPYDRLGDNQISLVNIEKEDRPDGNIAFILRDYYTLTVSNDDEPDNCLACDFVKDAEVRERLGEIIEEQAKNSNLEI